MNSLGAPSESPSTLEDSDGVPDGPDVSVFASAMLPCGRVVPNRLVKVAMYEHMAAFFGGPPNAHHFSLYARWAKYGWGMIITGNIQVSRSHLTLGRDMVIPGIVTEESVRPYIDLVAAIHGASPSMGDTDTSASPKNLQDSRALAIAQLSHAGRQSPNFLGGRAPFVPPLAPSAVRLGSDRSSNVVTWLLNRVLFQTSRSMDLNDIEDVVSSFIRGAKVATAAGFDGVQLHVAHGYLLSQFLSPKTNMRTDEYAATPTGALRLLERIVSSIRSEVAKEFIVGVKINSVDYLNEKGGDSADLGSETRALEHVRTIASWGQVDFIEISGGDYDDPSFMTTVSPSRPSPRQALFARFSRQALMVLEQLPSTTPLILLTGGLRSSAHLHTALHSRHADLLGIGRGSIVCPNLPDVLKERKTHDETPFAREPELGRWLPKSPLIGAGASMAWYVVAMRAFAAGGVAGLQAQYRLGAVESVLRMFLWVRRGRTVGRVLFCLSFVALVAGILTVMNGNRDRRR